MDKVMVALASGSEEIEAVTIIDVLRRAEIEVDVVSVDADEQLQITASRGVKLVADKLLSQISANDYCMFVLPGGVPGSERFRDSEDLITMLQQRHAQQWLAAICAAPAIVLAHHQLLGRAQVTGHPVFQQRLPKTQRTKQRVVVDHPHKLITSQGPGTAIEFSLALVAQIKGQALADSIAIPMIMAK
ncbi:DJ-1 family glyoxalase III [Agarivorans sp. QJM3NY_29]|uniref:DJ-1 family glyoxalase III n=1 Tax=unclassified Agarivorans TaxID=2636026 RepID=UPI003D7F0704